MDTVPYDLPLGDRISFEVEGRLEFSDAMCAVLVGGPSQTVPGRILVTARRLVFRPILGQPHEDLVEVVVDRLRELGVELPGQELEAWLATLDFEVEPLTGPEDYETGPGSEAWARKDPIERICVAANARLSGPRRFHAFAEDVPGWEFDEPVWLFLAEDERRRLVELGVVRPRDER